MSELGFGPKESMKLYCDNKAVIDIAHYPIQHNRAKHEEDLYSICEVWRSTGEQVADVLTKGLASRSFHFVLSKLGMRDIFALA